MWFLTCDGDHLGGKRLWLRPGSTHLFGRTHPKADNGQFHAIVHKSVSRQHFELSVQNVEPGDSRHVHSKSKISLKDLGSKVGTTLDGERFIAGTKCLDKTHHTIQLGNYDVLFHIRWQPIVFTFTSLSRTEKQAEDPLSGKRACLEPIDVKCITEYVTQYTTHVFAKKRNTAAGLQALVNGRSIVSDAYVTAVESVAEKQGEQQISALEEDFDANWPAALEFLPPPANEPNARPDRDGAFLPSTERSEMFDRYTFIFCTAGQYETLMPVITGGGGKALLREVPPPSEKPNVRDMIDYVKEVAGKKGDRGFKLSQQVAKGGVVVVRSGDKETSGGGKFFQDLDSALEQRSIEQNEFLEAILICDASTLKQPLEDDDGIEVGDQVETSQHVGDLGNGSTSGRTNEGHPSISQAQPPKDEPSSSAPASASRRKARRPITKSRFTGFDDYDATQVSKYHPPPSTSQPIQEEPSQALSEQQMEVDSQERPATQDRAAPAGSRWKRPAASQLGPEESSKDVIDGMLTGAAAMKKRKIEQERLGVKAEPKSPATSEKEGSGTTKRSKAKTTEGVDVRKAVHERREEEDRKRQEDEENLQHALEGMDIDQIREQIQIEEVEILPRQKSRRAGDEEHGEGWKAEWNGRANFKKFRKNKPGERHGDHEQAVQRRKVIVEMEQYKPKSQGHSDDYWLESSSSRTNKSKKQDSNSARNRHSQSLAADSANDASMSLSNRIRKSRQDDEAHANETEILADEIAGTARDTELQAAARRNTQTQSQTLGAKGPGQAAKKRPAAEPAAAPAAKRQSRIAPAPSRFMVEDSDDDDNGGVRFRRRK